MTTFTNFHAQFRGLVERAMLSELEDMLRMIGEGLRQVAPEATIAAERAAELLHAARRRAREDGHCPSCFLTYGHLPACSAPRNRLEAPRAHCHYGCGQHLGHLGPCTFVTEPGPAHAGGSGPLPL